MMNDLTGRRFGHLSILWPAGRAIHGSQTFIYWAVQCDCGNVRAVTGNNLQQGRCISCGCIKGKWNITHGMRLTSEYGSFRAAMNRCNNPKDKRFYCYGGRGIEFRFKTFEEFFAEVGLRPKGLILDRINTNGHYERGNIRWATISESNKNRRPRKEW